MVEKKLAVRGGGGVLRPEKKEFARVEKKKKKKNDPQILVVNFAKPIPLLVVVFIQRIP